MRPGNYAVTVGLPNGETAEADYFFLTPIPPQFSATDPLSFDIDASGRRLIGATGRYAVDTNANGLFELDFNLPSGSGPAAMAWDAADLPAVLGCCVRAMRDADADFRFALSEREGIHSSSVIFAPDLTFDSAGRFVAGYISTTSGVFRTRVAHDLDNDTDFDSSELTIIELIDGPVLAGGGIAVDASDRVAYAYAALRAGQDELRVAYDRNGNGSFSDAVGGNPELFTAATPGSLPTCVGTAFAPDGDLAVVHAAGAAPTLQRDLNADGDFADANESIALAGSAVSACAAAGGPALAVAYNDGGDLRLLVDRNDDGDFADTDEDQSLGAVGADARVGVAFDPSGRAVVVAGDLSDVSAFEDPAP